MINLFAIITHLYIGCDAQIKCFMGQNIVITLACHKGN